MAVTVTTHDARAEVVQWVEDILRQKRWTGTDLARKAGLAPSTILRMINDPDHPFTPSLKTLRKISEGAGVKIPSTIVSALDGDDAKEDAGRYRAGARLATGRGKTSTVPLRTISSLPAALQPANDQNSVVPAIPQVEGDAHAFAFYLSEGHLDPWQKPGSLIYVTRRRDPVDGDVVLVTRKDGRAFYRLLMEINEEGVVLSKTHPAVEEITIPFAEIAEIAIMVAFIAQV